MADDRLLSPLRAAGALLAMVAVTLVVAGLGAWVLIPSSWVASVDEGGAALGSALVTGRPWVEQAAVVWAAVSGPWCVHPFVALLAAALAVRRRITPRAAAVTVAVGLAGWGLGAVCKLLVARPRPEDALFELTSWSYPSGHATNIALGTVLVLSLLRSVRSPVIRWGGGALAIAGAALTAADRILLGVHHLSDVVMGLALGTVAALAALALLPRTRRAAP